MQKVKDIMSSPAVSITGDITIKEALDLLADRNISGVPVVDSEDKVIGIISDTDIIKYAHQNSVVTHTNLSGWVSPYVDVNDLASVKKGFDQLATMKVGSVMTKKVFTINQDADAGEAAKIMNRRNINRVPVIDNSDKLVGMVTRADIVKCMADL